MGQVLYNKYRSKNFAEVIGQDYITASLDNAIKNKKIAHAYLFTGPRGVGKTSVARILAHLVNDIPYIDGTTHLDIIEIDAASNRRIDEIRDLREKVNIAPTSSKYKVYIIDEVHMLTREAFNALLKTLEEPPEHVIFILATTESYKLPDTIISRTQRYNFKPIELLNLEKHLKVIAKNEKIKITDDAIKAIAKHGDGSFRDSISILDQIKNQDGEITLDKVNQSLGLTSSAEIAELIKLVEAGDASNLILKLNLLISNGYNPSSIAKQISSYLRQNIIIDGNTTEINYIDLMRDLIEIPSSLSPESLLEITLYKYLITSNHSNKVMASNVESKIIKPINTPDYIIKKINNPRKNNKEQKIIKEDEEVDLVTIKKTTTKKSSNNEFNLLIWQDLLNLIKKSNNTVYGILKNAKPKMFENKLELTFDFVFHQKRINDPKNKEIINLKYKELTGNNIEIECIFKKIDKKANIEPKSDDLSNIKNITNIFDGAKVIKS